MSTTDTKTSERTTTRTSPDLPGQWAVVLLDDDDHTYDYVIEMMQKIFSHSIPRAMTIAKAVDSQGRAVCLITHKEHAELKVEQIHSFGKDARIASCAGAMSSILEPAQEDVPGSDDEDC